MPQGYTDEEMNEMFEEFISKPGKTVREYLEEEEAKKAEGGSK